jgi:excisionase family DNA binding protein
MNPLTFFQEDLEDQLELLRQLPKLSKDTKRAVIDDLLETYVAARVRNPSRTKVDRKKTAPAPPQSQPPESYDLAGAAKVLGMSKRKLREMVKARRIGCTRVDYRNFLFKQADLEEFIGAYRNKPKRI